MLFGQQLVARRDSGELELYYRRISAVIEVTWRPAVGRQESLWRTGILLPQDFRVACFINSVCHAVL